MLSEFVRRGQLAFQSCDWLQVFSPLSRQPVLTTEQRPLPGSLTCTHPILVLVLLQGSGSCPRTTLLGAGRTPPAPVRAAGLYTNTAPGRRRKTARQREGKEFGPVTDSGWGPYPNGVDTWSYQWQVFNYKLTAINLHLVNLGDEFVENIRMPGAYDAQDCDWCFFSRMHLEWRVNSYTQVHTTTLAEV